MARPVAVLGLIMAALVAAAPARADERDRATIDRVDVRPSPIHGLARIRALVSATTLQGARIPEAGKPQITARHFTGTGTRFLTEAGKTAISELFARSFNK